jgi:hypothetical protein
MLMIKYYIQNLMGGFMIKSQTIIAWVIILSMVSLFFVTGCMSVKALSKPGTTTTVILIRHADRNEQSFLTPKGKLRAKALVESVKSMNISVIYSPNLKRNLDTVQPLADYLGIDITLAPKTSFFSVDAIAKEILDKHAGKVILWVGNVSGNLQAMYRRLGGKRNGPLKYGEISVLTIPDKGEVVESNLRFDP